MMRGVANCQHLLCSILQEVLASDVEEMRSILQDFSLKVMVCSTPDGFSFSFLTPLIPNIVPRCTVRGVANSGGACYL